MSRAPFIVVDGHDLVGKDTQLKLLEDRIKQETEVAPVITAEPWEETQAGQYFRGVLNKEYPNPGPEMMTRIIHHNRYEHHGRIEPYASMPGAIIPTIDSGIPVLTSRFDGSTIAYQSNMHLLSKDKPISIEEINDIAEPHEHMTPDLTINITITENEFDKRLAKRAEGGEKADLFEEKRDFMKAVAKTYREMDQHLPGNVVQIDGMGTREEVHERLWERAAPFFVKQVV